MSRWFRHYAGMMRDDKLVRVAIRSHQPIERVCWIWGAILESASEVNDGGRYDFDTAEAAYFLRAPEDDVLAVADALASAGHLSEGFVVKWGHRQFQSDRSAERQRRYRERQKTSDSDGEQGERDRQRDEGVTSPKRDSDAAYTETETETDIVTDVTIRPRARQSVSKPDDVSDQVWSDFKQMRDKQRAPPTATALAAIRREASKVGWSMEQALAECCERSWRGFKAEWIKESHNGQRNDQHPVSASGLGRTVDAMHDFVRIAEGRRSG